MANGAVLIVYSVNLFVRNIVVTLYKMDTNKKKILELLEKSNGIVSTACLSMGLPRSTYYLWLKEDQEFADAVADIQEVAIDFVESKLMEKINGITMLGKSGGDEEDHTYTLPPSDTAIIFYLKTKGKKRGYVEKSEIDINAKTIQINFED